MKKFYSKKAVIFLALLFCAFLAWPVALSALQQLSGASSTQPVSSAQVAQKRLQSIRARKSARETSRLQKKCLIAVKKKPQRAKADPCAEILYQTR